MRYVLSLLKHYIYGKIRFKYVVYGLRKRPVAIISDGVTWVIDPDFEV